jgi:hypothetical protein
MVGTPATPTSTISTTNDLVTGPDILFFCGWPRDYSRRNFGTFPRIQPGMRARREPQDQATARQLARPLDLIAGFPGRQRAEPASVLGPASNDCSGLVEQGRGTQQSSGTRSPQPGLGGGRRPAFPQMKEKPWSGLGGPACGPSWPSWTLSSARMR